MYDPADVAKAMLNNTPGEFKIGLCTSKYDGWTIEELIVGTNIKVGDRVEAPRHGRGTVLAISGEDAWVQTEGKDYPLTFDIRKLKLVPKPRQWEFDITTDNGGGTGWWNAVVERNVKSVELTPEVRERLKDLL